MNNNRPLRVFLCHSKNDAKIVRDLYEKLRAESWIQPWLDEEELFPGMDWNMEIEKAIEVTDVILVCLSKSSITKEGYVQREIRIALDYADYKPEGTLFIIPVRLEECTLPKRLTRWQYVDYFGDKREREYERLLVSLNRHAVSLGLTMPEKEKKIGGEVSNLVGDSPDETIGNVQFIINGDVIGSSLNAGNDNNIRVSETNENLPQGNIDKHNSQISTPCDQVIAAIKTSQPNHVLLINDFIDWMMEELARCSPSLEPIEGQVSSDTVMVSLDQTINVVVDFTKLTNALAYSSSLQIPRLYKVVFEKIIDNYNVPEGFSGSFSEARMRFYQFVSHELLITMLSILLDAEKFDVMTEILNESLYIENDLYIGTQNVSYSFLTIASRGVNRKLIDLMIEKMSQRHSEGELAKLMPMKRLAEAECFLSLRKDENEWKWHPIFDLLWKMRPSKMRVEHLKKERNSDDPKKA